MYNDIMIVCETPCRTLGIKLTAQEREKSDKRQLKSYIEEHNTPNPVYVNIEDKGIVFSKELNTDVWQTVFYFKYDMVITDIVKKECYA